MSNFFQTVFSNIGIADILDIVVVAFIVYKVLEFIRETRAEQLVKGLLLLAPADLIIFEHSSKVAPVVYISSISNMFLP